MYFYLESEKFGSLMSGFNSIWTILVQYVVGLLNIPNDLINLCIVNSGKPKPEFTALSGTGAMNAAFNELTENPFLVRMEM